MTTPTPRERPIPMPAPKRIQRSRSKGWKMPPNAVYVGRPTIWGNPYDTADEYREWLLGNPAYFQPADVRDYVVSWMVERLAGKDLACWCPLDRPCHADILLEMANAG